MTDRRIIYKTGFINRHTVEMHMDKVESVDVDQSILGRMLSYGDIPSAAPAKPWSGSRTSITRSISAITSLPPRAIVAGKLKHLGKPTRIPAAPDPATLDRVANPHADTRYVARFTAPEFTVLCPITGQPDFALLIIDYAPRRWLLESKSLKLHLASYRNHGGFHEECTVGIGKRIAGLLKPKWLRIGGYWYPRGGIPIDVYWQTGKLPSGVWVPDQGVSPYPGRG